MKHFLSWFFFFNYSLLSDNRSEFEPVAKAGGLWSLWISSMSTKHSLEKAMMSLGELWGNLGSGGEPAAKRRKRDPQQPVGQNELMSRGHMFRRGSKLSLKNLSVGVLWFPFFTTFYFSVTLCEIGQWHSGPVQLSWTVHKTEPGAVGTQPLSMKLYQGTTLLCPHTALSHGDLTVRIGEELSFPLWLNRDQLSSSSCFLSAYPVIWFGVLPGI